MRILVLATLLGLAAMSRSQLAPYSFTYGGQSAQPVLPNWKGYDSEKPLDASRTQRTETKTDPVTGLEVRTVEVRYSNFPVVEYTVYLKNTGAVDSPIARDLQALDIHYPIKGDLTLHHNVGSPADGNDYRPLETPLPPGTSKRISAAGGRPTNSDLSYFNLSWNGGGKIVVVGWPGQWAATFTREANGNLWIQAGQEHTNLKLHPGEEFRTPLIVTLDYKGDWIQGQNIWRRWMILYGMPHPGGKLPKPMMLTSSSRAYGEMVGANEANQIMSIGRWLEEGFKLDYWWMDAGWYVQDRGWPQVGTWEVDPKRFPNGFKPISDFAHRHGVKTLVWFEPERVAPNTWLADNHPEWLLNPLRGLTSRRSSALGTNEPCVVYNASDRPVDWNGIHWDPRSLSFHPGPKGEYSVVRFTAPADGEFHVRATFKGIDQKTTTDVHVLAAGKSLYDAYVLLNGYGRESSFDQRVRLEKGQPVDFVVGYGNNHYEYDSTGLKASIATPDGAVHDAAREYGESKNSWNYGYLTPGDKPDSTTFRPYDKQASGSAGGDQLFDLGNSIARKWLTDHIDKLLVDNGIDLYRQDFNIDPLSFWRGNDAEDRQGITENRYVVGYLAYWDELSRRHPNMLIDSCASGGRRNDLETMRRAVPLWRSDYAYEPIGHQCMTYGIAMWLPYFGTGTVAVENAPYYGSGVTPVHPYAFWSNAVPALGCGIDIREKGIDYAALRTLFAEWRSIGPYYYGDFYPLTPWTRQDNNWIAWEYTSPEDHSQPRSSPLGEGNIAGHYAPPPSGDRSQSGSSPLGEGRVRVKSIGVPPTSGIIQAFRRPKSTTETLVVKLRGLDPNANYRLTVIDGAQPIENRSWTGAQLMESGIPITIASAPGAAVVKFERA